MRSTIIALGTLALIASAPAAMASAAYRGAPKATSHGRSARLVQCASPALFKHGLCS
jgi:hypothetical protein